MNASAIPEFLTFDQSLDRVNQGLKASGDGSVSRATLYKLRNIYCECFPRSKWISNDRLVYSRSVVLFLYFLAKMHCRMRSFRLTSLATHSVLQKCQDAPLTDKLPTFSAIDSFFLSNNDQISA